jgi:hypothetical protein
MDSMHLAQLLSEPITGVHHQSQHRHQFPVEKEAFATRNIGSIVQSVQAKLSVRTVEHQRELYKEAYNTHR